MNNSNCLLSRLLKVFLMIVLIDGCTRTSKINTSLPFEIQISGPISNDTLIKEDNVKEILQKFNAKIVNNNNLKILNFGAYNEDNDQIIPYTISHTKKANNLLNKVSIQDVWEAQQCKIAPGSFAEKKIIISFYPEYDTIHFEFKFFVGEEHEMPVRVSYLIQNGKLKKRTSMKFRRN